jgi:hypothetical protein
MGPGSKLRNIDKSSGSFANKQEENKKGQKGLDSLLEANISDIDLEIDEPEETIGLIQAD